MALPAKILVLSDTHFARKSQRLSSEITKYFDEVDYIIHSGDFTSTGVLEQLQDTGKFVGVYGNMDPQEIRDDLPEINEIELDDLRIGIIHGWGAPDGIIERIHGLCKDHGYHVVVVGHTHNHFEQRHDGIWYYNAGSPVDKMFARENTILLLTINSKEDIKSNFIKL